MRFWSRRRKNDFDADDGVGTLAVVIPVLNEEFNIAAAIRSALGDENGGESGSSERQTRSAKNHRPMVVVVDGGSADATVAEARRAGADRVLRCATRGRGAQLACGVAAVCGAVGGGRNDASSSSSSSSDSSFLPPPRTSRSRSRSRKRPPDTLLFLHADSCLPKGYRGSISRALLSNPSSPSSWGAFETVYPTGLHPATSLFLAACVALRTRCLGLPYGDQGIFVKSDVLEKIGGVRRDLPLMEDVELVERLSLAGKKQQQQKKKKKKKSSSSSSSSNSDKNGREINSRPAVARGAVSTSGRRWAERGLLKTTALNLWTLARWKGGWASAEELAREYYRR